MRRHSRGAVALLKFGRWVATNSRVWGIIAANRAKHLEAAKFWRDVAAREVSASLAAWDKVRVGLTAGRYGVGKLN